MDLSVLVIILHSDILCRSQKYSELRSDHDAYDLDSSLTSESTVLLSALSLTSVS
jgi:hypothetical protein